MLWLAITIRAMKHNILFTPFTTLPTCILMLVLSRMIHFFAQEYLLRCVYEAKIDECKSLCIQYDCVSVTGNFSSASILRYSTEITFSIFIFLQVKRATEYVHTQTEAWSQRFAPRKTPRVSLCLETPQPPINGPIHGNIILLCNCFAMGLSTTFSTMFSLVITVLV